MALSIIWLSLIIISLLFALPSGRLAAVSAAAFEGADAAVRLCITLAGSLCLWSGINELLSRSGALALMSRLLSPVLNRVFPAAAHDSAAADAISANFSANLLGFGNAATPAGISAARRLSDGSGRATNELCRLVVLNTASIQLLPTTVCALRAAEGCQTPFDILPAVWLTSLCSVCAGLGAARIFEKIWKS